MANRSRCSIILLFLIGTVISSCTPGQGSPPAAVSPVPGTIEPSETLLSPTPTTIPVTSTPRIETTHSLLPGGYTGLSDGEYFLIFSQNGFEVISIQERAHFKLLNITSGSIYLSQDQRHLVVISAYHIKDKLINLETVLEEELPFLKGCGEVVLSRDGTTFLANCEASTSLEVYSISRDGKKKVQLTNCGADYGDCKEVAYSPDGQWITYYWVLAGVGRSSIDGFYLTDSSCQDTEYKCGEMALGPLDIRANYGWAPNNQYLASSGSKGISIFEVNNNEIKEVLDIETPTGYVRNDIFWSPDSSRIAYSIRNEIWVVDVTEGICKVFEEFNYDVYLVGWVNIKDGKVLP